MAKRGCLSYDYIKLPLLISLSILFLIFFSSVSFGAVIQGNVTLKDIDADSSAIFNFTKNSTGTTGHFRYNNITTGGVNTGFIEAVGGAQLFYMGFFYY